MKRREKVTSVYKHLAVTLKASKRSWRVNTADCAHGIRFECDQRIIQRSHEDPRKFQFLPENFSPLVTRSRFHCKESKLLGCARENFASGEICLPLGHAMVT